MITSEVLMITIFANPVSGARLGERTLQIVTEYLKSKNVEFIVHSSTYSGEPVEIAKKYKDELKKVIIIGGDGTFNEFTNGLNNLENYDICFIPGGTGNDFSYSLGIYDITKILDKFLNGESTKIDYLKVNDKKCLNVCGTGLDTEVLQKYNALPKKNKAGYVKCLIKVLLNFEFYKLRLTIDDEKVIEGEFMLAACCNGKRFGANIYISPESKIDDGFINLILIKKIKKIIIPFALLGFIKGKHLNKSYAEQILCKKVKIENLSGDMIYNLDGQLFEGKEVNVNICEGKLNTYIQKNYTNV